MASTNVEIARRAVAAVNERDPDSFIALIADEFEWVTPVANVDTTTYRGADGVRRFFQDGRRWQRIEARVEEYRDLGDRVLLLGEVSWSGPGGRTLDVVGPLSSLVNFEEGKLTRIETYRDVDDALAAAGA